MYNYPIFKLSTVAIITTLFGGANVQASPIGLTVIPEASCEIRIAKSPRTIRVSAILTTRSEGVGKYYLTADSLMGDIMRRNKTHGTFHVGANHVRNLGAIYLEPFAEGINANMRVNWEGQEITCTEREQLKPVKNQFGVGAVLR